MAALLKCRQYQFRFGECGHLVNSPEWIFHHTHGSAECEPEKVVIERPQHCFERLGQLQLPIWRRNFNDKPSDRTIWSPIFTRILQHHKKYPDGPYHFARHDPRALWGLSGSLTEKDRIYLVQVEEACDAAVWTYASMKDVIDEYKVTRNDENFQILRSVVPQLRFAHLTSLVQRMEFSRYDDHQLATAKLAYEKRCLERVKGIIIPVKEHELGKDDECPICYHNLRKLAKLGPASADAPVRTVCGHVFSRSCISEWLNEQGQTCPYCRTDFSLDEQDEADWSEVEENLESIGYLSDDRKRATPWWLKMIRGEKFVQE